MWNIQDVKKFIKTGIRGVAAAIVIGLGVWAWWHFQPQDLPDGFAAGNGRIEAVEIDIAAKTAGRVREIVVNEGEFVRAGQVLAKMDTAVLEAQLQEAEAQLRRALIGIETAQSQVTQRKAEKQAAENKERAARFAEGKATYSDKWVKMLGTYDDDQLLEEELQEELGLGSGELAGRRKEMKEAEQRNASAKQVMSEDELTLTLTLTLNLDPHPNP